MVLFAPFVGFAAVYAGFASAAPKHKDSVQDTVSLMDVASVTISTMDSMMTSPSYGGSSPGSYASGSLVGSSYSGGSYGGMGSSAGSWSNIGSSVGGGGYGGGSGGGAATTSTPCTTSTSVNSYSTPAYGSGSSGPSLRSYVECMASWGAPTATSTPPTTTTAATGSGAGMTHTVIVAPTQGILRYVPFVVNASVGDTIQFIWNANNHTVTKSSELAICNKTMDAPFASGQQNKSFVFTQTVNTTNTTFYYCGTPGHCPKGMFGIINPPNAAMGSNTSLSGMIPAMVANSTSMASMWSYAQTVTQNNTMASSWGGNIDISGMPQWAYQFVAENVMYTRTFLAANPAALNADGSVNLSSAGSTPLMVPVDITSLASNSTSSSGGSSSGAGSSSGSGPSSNGSSSNPYPTMTNSARNFGSSSVLAGFTVAVAFAFAF
ncbi:hypothetical protein BS17DRAFT_813828 [Gyrodon lividus]|nr:hypothetical protein BS17DRAFT_813828 [Gyrodon lividus]